MLVKKLKIAVAMACVLVVASVGAFAQQTQTVESGLTSVKLSTELVGALQTLGVKAGTVAPTEIMNGKARFPVVGGVIDLKGLNGEIIHSGGLTFTAGTTVVRLQAFTIDTTGKAPVLTGIAVKDGMLLGRVPLFDLDLSASTIKVEEEFLKISNVKLTLDATAAADLNSFFSATAFTGGFPIGTANVFAELEH